MKKSFVYKLFLRVITGMTLQSLEGGLDGLQPSIQTCFYILKFNNAFDGCILSVVWYPIKGLVIFCHLFDFIKSSKYSILLKCKKAYHS